MQLQNGFSLSTLSGVAAALQAPTADLGYVKYQGVSNATLGVNSFLGIRYAEPPINDLRWRAPVPVNTNSSTSTAASSFSYYTDATKYAPQCVQATSGYNSEFVPYDYSLASEDCLFMNIITPSEPASTALPVVVNMHGGGYIAGNSTSEDGTVLVSYSNGAIIYISIQYRLGAYGFLAGDSVRADGELNAGLLDQRLALEWVQEHIGAFGGDPKQVTIEGASAGGGSVIYQLMKGGGELHPPFRSAIPQYSGLLPHRNTFTQNAIYGKLLDAANCTDLACLRSLPYERLANASQQSYYTAYEAGLYGHGDFAYTPVVDRSFVLDLPSRALAAGKFTKVPLFNTVDEFEGIGFINDSITTQSEVARDISHLFIHPSPPSNNPSPPSSTFTPSLLTLYPPSSYGPSFRSSQALFSSPLLPQISSLALAAGFNLSSPNPAPFQSQAIWGDAFIHCPSTYLASAAFDAQPTKVPIWKLRFNAGFYAHTSGIEYLLKEKGQEGAFVVNGTLAGFMKEWVLGFVRFQDPNFGVVNEEGRPWFPQYGAENDVLWVNETDVESVRDVDAGARCAFFEENAGVVRV